jgi:hypothetical protein
VKLKKIINLIFEIFSFESLQFEEDTPLKPLQINNGTGNMRIMDEIKPYDPT